MRAGAALFQRHPCKLTCVLCAAKGATCDIIVQTKIENKQKIDKTRLAVFTSFGFIYAGFWQYQLFSNIMPKVVPAADAFVNKPILQKIRDPAGIKGVLVQLFIENGINNAMLYFPIFYVLQSTLEGKRPLDGLSKYWENIVPDCLDIWSVYVPFQIVNFSITPIYMRSALTACVSFFWTSYVSFTRGTVGERKTLNQ